MASHDEPPILPREPIKKITGPLERFMHVESAGGIVLLLATIAALILANSRWAESFIGFWQTPVAITVGDHQVSHSLKHWVSDGLMAVFFFVMGLEVKRELVIGELREFRNAIVPIAGAIGGMVVPAGIYLALQGSGPAASGWGIPMATDIAFVVGCIAILGKRVPVSLRVMLVSLAIADDIGAILVIAFGYTDSIDTTALAYGGIGIAVILFLAHLGARSLIVYTILGFLVWWFFHESGVHATIAGVILGLMTPAKPYLDESWMAKLLHGADQVLHGGGWGSLATSSLREFRRAVRETVSPVVWLESLLHPWVSFVIMPIFALANAGVPIRIEGFADPVATAIAAALAIGKPVGIVGCCLIVVKLGIAKLPPGVGWGNLTGGGLLAGIGFTMSLFIAGLALEATSLDAAKLGILGGSALCAVLGIVVLVKFAPEPTSAATE